MLVAAVLLAVGSYLIYGLRDREADAHATDRALGDLETNAFELNALEWEAISVRRLSPERRQYATEVRDRVAATVADLARLDNDATVTAAITAWREYDAALQEEIALVAAGQFSQAATLDEARVDPAFASVTARLNDAIAAHRESATDDERVGMLSTIGVLVLFGGFVTGAILRYRRSRRLARIAATEREVARRADEMFRGLLRESTDMVVAFDRRGQVMFQTPSVERTLGYPPGGLDRRTMRRAMGRDGYGSFLHAWSAALAAEGASGRFACPFVAAGGRSVELEGTFRNHLATAGVGAIVLNCRDVTERKRFESEMVHLASHDPLTGLFNRRRFEEELAREIERAHAKGSAAAVMVIDLDNLRGINEEFGHAAGDAVLRNVGRLLRLRVGGSDVARFAGDEFGVLVVHSEPDAVRARAHELREAIRSEATIIDGQPVSTTASVGVALFPGAGTTVADLLRQAQSAMREAKVGSDAVVVYSTPIDPRTALAERRSWESRLRWALENDRLALFAQPILDLRGGRTHFEVLVRMLDADGTAIPPAEFLPAAEASSLIHLVDRRVVTKAIEAIAEHAEDHPRLQLSVNLSGRSLSEPGLLTHIRDEIARLHVNPRSLTFEVTETAAIADIDRSRWFIDTLRRAGCRFAIDDFGSGFASFAYLRHLPVDQVKIDGSFIRGLTASSQDQHLVRAILEVCHGLGKEVVAEFVENEGTAKLLREYGVDYAQGYLYGVPGPLETVLLTWRWMPGSQHESRPEQRAA